MSNDYEIFEGKSLSDVFKEIHQNSEVKRIQIESMLSHLTSMVVTPDDALQLVPVIKEYMDVAVKNDEQLVKIAAIVVKILQAEMRGGSTDELLTESEKEQLMQSIEEEVDIIQKESYLISDSTDKISKKIDDVEKN